MTSIQTNTPIPLALPATDTPSPTEPPANETPTATVITEGGILTEWFWIDMFDEENGWAETDQSVLITSDGGTHWEDVTPEGILDPVFRAYFLDASTSLVLAKYDDTQTILFRTMDGGRTWESVIMPLYQGDYFFVDARNGWDLSYSCGTGRCDGILYRTTDGGETWEPIHSFGPSTDDDPNTIPYLGIKDGITFKDLNHGWLKLDWAPEIGVFDTLYSTKDGGVTWQPQDLPLPPGADKSSIDKALPHFFTDQEGYLPVYFFLDQPVLILYMTRDGGATWKETPGILSKDHMVYDCASLQDCWIMLGETLMVTHDGAQTWAQVNPNMKMGAVSKLEFVNNRNGWAISREESGKYQLYRTDDGGMTWTPLLP